MINYYYIIDSAGGLLADGGQICFQVSWQTMSTVGYGSAVAVKPFAQVLLVLAIMNSSVQPLLICSNIIMYYSSG